MESVHVAIRIRPASSYEEPVAKSLAVSEQSLALNVKNRRVEFGFDRVFDEDATQATVYEDLQSHFHSVLDGVNCCLLAYGQTGSGKTFSMVGPECDDGEDFLNESSGLIPRAVNDIFSRLNEYSHVTVHCSYLEVYCEKIYDLLVGSKRNQSPIGIREQTSNKTGKNEVYVENLSEFRVSTLEDVWKILKKGNRNRAVRATDMNEHSSRAHSVLQFRFNLEDEDKDTGVKTVLKSTLTMVDLAGSEKMLVHGMATGEDMDDRLKELKNINLSLSALGNVISALTEEGRTHVPYRDSTLTRLLQDSLGGNSRTIVLTTVTPLESWAEETCSSLKFADRAKRVMMNVHVNEIVDDAELLKRAHKEIKRLKKMMSKKGLKTAKKQIKSLKEEIMELRRENERLRGMLQNGSGNIGILRRPSGLKRLSSRNSQMSSEGDFGDDVPFTACSERSQRSQALVSELNARDYDDNYDDYDNEEILDAEVIDEEVEECYDEIDNEEANMMRARNERLELERQLKQLQKMMGNESDNIEEIDSTTAAEDTEDDETSMQSDFENMSEIDSPPPTTRRSIGSISSRTSTGRSRRSESPYFTKAPLPPSKKKTNNRRIRNSKSAEPVRASGSGGKTSDPPKGISCTNGDIGIKVELYRARLDQWEGAMIVAFDNKSGRHRLKLDRNGTQEWRLLSNQFCRVVGHDLEFLQSNQNQQSVSPVRRRAQKRPIVPVPMRTCDIYNAPLSKIAVSRRRSHAPSRKPIFQIQKPIPADSMMNLAKLASMPVPSFLPVEQENSTPAAMFARPPKNHPNSPSPSKNGRRYRSDMSPIRSKTSLEGQITHIESSNSSSVLPDIGIGKNMASKANSFSVQKPEEANVASPSNNDMFGEDDEYSDEGFEFEDDFEYTDEETTKENDVGTSPEPTSDVNDLLNRLRMEGF
eukprot:TRINITY_DN5054_c0_g1_i1.p1 TRINITY_DN5054_c0_g1~~TRINITY_DN5054_c0_g1_i1.p1  ORF type:complete len:927 (+),score=274.36 TRINITY_DN5054_c0_g1_i1:144-2924(+)